MLNKVKLANGKEVTWEEFSKWSPQRQHMSLIGCRGTKGHKHSDETRKLISEVKKQWSPSTEQREHLSAVLKGKNKGQKKNLPIHTPNGVFPNRNALHARLVADGFTPIYAKKKVRQWMKEYPTHYYLIVDGVDSIKK